MQVASYSLVIWSTVTYYVISLFAVVSVTFPVIVNENVFRQRYFSLSFSLTTETLISRIDQADSERGKVVML